MDETHRNLLIIIGGIQVYTVRVMIRVTSIGRLSEENEGS